MELITLTIKQAHEGLKNGKFTSVDLTRAYLENIKKLDGDLPAQAGINAFLLVDEKGALEQAVRVDKKIALSKAERRDFPMLCGIPCAIKDAILVKGLKCTAASKILENFTATYNATVIERLKNEGAVILGKTNTDEFTMGASGENSAFGATKNPNDKTRVTGGSSSGSAAVISANMACYALASDTGGSVRLPASFCGVLGLNPTYGAVSRYGLIAHASSLDQIGIMAKNTDDSEIVLKVISGKDKMDATSADYVYKPFDTAQGKSFGLKGLKIGVPKEYFAEGLDKNVEKIVKDAIKKAEEKGVEIVEISLPMTKYAIACYYIIVPSEASSNLARFDGIRYGLSEKGNALLDVYLKSKGHGFGSEPKRRILTGTYCLSSGYYDAYYKKAQEVRQLIRQDFVDAFQKVDLIFCPVSPFPAFKIGEKADDPLSMYLVDAYTGSMKLAGLPGISLPAGKIGDLPVGLQIIGKHFEENKILSVAKQLEEILKAN